MPSVLSWARRYVAAGFSVFPIRANGEKAPAVSTWTPYQQRRPTDDELANWFADDSYGIAIVCGAVSGGLVVMDFETEKAFSEWLVYAEPLADEIGRSPLVVTPSGGRHLYLRCPNPPRNLKLARDESGETSIETRGGGGYVLAPGSPAGCHELNKTYEWERYGWLKK